MTNLIKLENMSVTYHEKTVPVKALQDISYEFQQGQFYSVVGKSGCGKTTLLNVLGGIIKPSTGYYWFDDQNVAGWNEKRISTFRNQDVGFVVQHFALINDLQAYDNIALPLRVRHLKSAEIDEKVRDALEKVGMMDKLYSRPYELSGGEKQRIAIARAFVTEPKMILADEPTGALDGVTGNEIMELFRQINYAGTTIIMVTHDMELAQKADLIVEMADGKIL